MTWQPAKGKMLRRDDAYGSPDVGHYLILKAGGLLQFTQSPADQFVPWTDLKGVDFLLTCDASINTWTESIQPVNPFQATAWTLVSIDGQEVSYGACYLSSRDDAPTSSPPADASTAWTLPALSAEALRTLGAIKQLEDGWTHGGARFAPDVLARAEYLARTAIAVAGEPEILPAPGGSIELTWYLDDEHYIVFYVDGDGVWRDAAVRDKDGVRSSHVQNEVDLLALLRAERTR